MKMSVAAPAPIEQPEPMLDSKALRRCLGQYPTGVTIVTSSHDGQLFGMAVNSFAAVSLEPPLVLWSIRQESRSASAFLAAGHFAVSILADDQVEVAQAFGTAQPDRFERIAWREGLHGAPLITGAIAHLECSTETVHAGGDHHILIGRVVQAARLDGAPLVFSQGQYAVTGSHPDVVAPVKKAATSPDTAHSASSEFIRLLSVASHRLSQDFQTHRDALGLTSAMIRITAVLEESRQTLSQLEQSTYLGRLTLEDALANMCSRRLVVGAADQGYELTAHGSNLREEVAQRAGRFTAERLQGIASADVDATCRLLKALQAG